MFGKHQWFIRRLGIFENDFLDICDYIPLTGNTALKELGIGAGSKLINFSLNVCSEIETLCRKLLTFSIFDSYPQIDSIRTGHQDIDEYRKIFKWKWDGNSSYIPLSEKILYLRWENTIPICPFKKFEEDKNPDWFQFYSKYKHDKILFAEKLEFFHCLRSLAALTILLIYYPYNTEMSGTTGYYNSEIFDASLAYITRPNIQYNSIL